MTEIEWCEDCERPKVMCECPSEATSPTRQFDYLTHLICLAAENEFDRPKNSSSEYFAKRVQGLLQDIRDNLTRANRRNYTIDLLEKEIERLRQQLGLGGGGGGGPARFGEGLVMSGHGGGNGEEPR